MKIIRFPLGKLKRIAYKILIHWLVNLIDKSGLLFYNLNMDTEFMLVQQALLEDAAQRDLVTARRKLLVEFLSRERYLTRSGLMSRVEMVLGKDCFGNTSWEDVFYRDMKAVKKSFRAAGYDLAYSRNNTRAGYYLRGEGEIGQAVERQIKGAVDKIDPRQVAVTRSLSPAQRVQQGLSITNLAHQVTAYRQAKEVINHG